MNPVFQTLLLQEHPKKKFKPPKRLFQIEKNILPFSGLLTLIGE
jgi:hypothetical protein